MKLFTIGALLSGLQSAFAAPSDNDKLLLNHCGINDAGTHYMLDADTTTYYTMDEANQVFCNIWLFQATGAKMLDEDTYGVLSGERKSWTCDDAATLATAKLGHDCGIGAKSPTPGGGGGGDLASQVLSWLTEENYNNWFPMLNQEARNNGRNCHCVDGKICSPGDEEFITYQDFVTNINKYADDIFKYNDKEADTDMQKKIFSMFLGHVAQETGAGNVADGVFCWVLERIHYPDPIKHDGTSNDPSPDGQWAAAYKVSPANVYYCGRGVLQLSHDYNYRTYGAFSKPDDKEWLIRNPELITHTGEQSVGSGFWFIAKYSKGTGFQPGLSNYIMDPYIDGSNLKRDFALTTYMINGGYECGNVEEQYHVESVHRATAYKVFYNRFTGNDIEDTDDALLCVDIPGKGNASDGKIKTWARVSEGQ